MRAELIRTRALASVLWGMLLWGCDEGGAQDALLGPGPRELIVIAALCTRGEIDIAGQHIRRAYDYGMTRRQVLEAISSIVPMTGMISMQLGLRAMQLADRGASRRRAGKRRRKSKKA